MAQIVGDMCAAHILLNIWLIYCDPRCDLRQVTTEACSPRGGSGSGAGLACIELSDASNRKPTDRRGRATFLDANGNTSASLDKRGAYGQPDLLQPRGL